MLTVDVYHPVISDWKLLPRSIRTIVTGIMFTLHPQIVYNAYNIFTITQISPTEPLHFYVANFRRITTCCLIPHQSVIAIKTISQLIIPFNDDLWMDETYIIMRSIRYTLAAVSSTNLYAYNYMPTWCTIRLRVVRYQQTDPATAYT